MDLPPASPTKPSTSAVDGEGTGTTTGGALPSSDLWSSILDSVSGSRGVVTRNCIVLGGQKSGKTTLISRLGSPTGGEETTAEASTSGAGGGQAGNTNASTSSGVGAPLDLGLSYSVLDVGDDADEETLARLGIYQLPSPLPPYPSLLSLALSRATLLESLVVVVLDWERPWHFIRDLESWLAVVQTTLERGEEGGKEGWERVEGRERVEAHWRAYAEPPLASANATAPPPTMAADAESPLPPGVLTNNLGLGIVIVCTKADQINSLEREKDFKEEQFDYVQQALRTIALKYGAALFFTSHSRPTSFAKLRSYILHRLFAASSTSSAPAAAEASAGATTTTSRSFPFPHRANVVDRDQVVVPAGWDSWGKIRILRDRFDAEGLGKGWDAEFESEVERVRSGRPRGENGVDEEEEKIDEEGRRIVGATRLFEDVVLDLDGDDQPINMANLRVEAQDEQTFLKAHYETLQKDREKDPRAAFAARPGATGAPNGTNEPASTSTFGASVVGPMASSSLNLPSVERALERDPDDVTARLAKMVRKDSSQGGRTPISPAFPSPNVGSQGGTSPGLSSSLLSPSNSSSGAPGGQNEVLANFFNSLLQARSSGGGSTPGARPAGASLSPPLGSSTAGPRPSSSASAAMNSRSSSHQSNGGDR